MALNLTNYGTWIPPKIPAEQIKAVASRDFIEITVPDIDTNLGKQYGRNYIKVIEISKNKTDWEELKGNIYYFERNNEDPTQNEYPEWKDLENYGVRAYYYDTEADKKGPVSNVVKIDTSNYGTWEVGKPLISVRVSDRTISLVFAQPTRSDNRQRYGNIQYKVSVKKYEQSMTLLYLNPVNNQFYLDPNYEGEPYELKDNETVLQTGKLGEHSYFLCSCDDEYYCPATSSSPYESEENYKDPDAEEDYLISDSTYVQTMPLTGQDKPVGEGYVGLYDTAYSFRVCAFNEKEEDSDFSYRNATALCTNIADIVKANADFKSLIVNKLSAISANIGMIAQGGFGDFANLTNFWALSTLMPEDTDLPEPVYEGAFRVGNKNQYINVRPIVSASGEVTDYSIEIKAGEISLYSGADAGLGGGTRIKNQNDETKSMLLTSEGIFIQEQPYSGSPWVTVGQMGIKNGNLTITNAPYDDPSLPTTAILLENAPIYHFDVDMKDENGGNASNLSFADGSEITTDNNGHANSNTFKGAITKNLGNTPIGFFARPSNVINVGEFDISDNKNSKTVFYNLFVTNPEKIGLTTVPKTLFKYME